MSEQGPEFFFSYARGDYSLYLEKFFDELEEAVAMLRPPETDEFGGGGDYSAARQES